MEEVTFKLQVFEGPLELLMHLIQKNKVSIYDIPIALITEQYFEYMEKMKELDLEVTGEFIVMASELLLIKSKLLLPSEEEDPEAEDPRAELVDKLLEYRRYKEAAQFFSRHQNSSQLLYFKRPDDIELPRVRPIEGTIPLSALVKAFNDILERRERQKPPEREAFTNIIRRETVSVRSKIRFLQSLLSQRRSVPFDELFAGVKSRPEAVSTFLALLELIRSGRIEAVLNSGKIICVLVGDEIEPERGASGY